MQEGNAVVWIVAVLRGESGAVEMFTVGVTGRCAAGMTAMCAYGDVAGMLTYHRPQEGSMYLVSETKT